jgi:hypothetical protein
MHRALRATSHREIGRREAEETSRRRLVGLCGDHISAVRLQSMCVVLDSERNDV